MKKLLFLAGLFILAMLAGAAWLAFGGSGSKAEPTPWEPPPVSGLAEPTSTAVGFPFPTPNPHAPQLTPTPDAPRVLPTPRAQRERYTIRAGDTLGTLARKYRVGIQDIISTNHIKNPNLLTVGQRLTIPAPRPVGDAPPFKILPDSELVNGPYAGLFSVQDFVERRGGFLRSYREEVHGEVLTGAEIVERVAQNYSVSPRTLLAMLEYRGHWLSRSKVKGEALAYPLGWPNPYRRGLWMQLNWAANELNRGYYLWQVNALGVFVTADGKLVRANPTVNAGTAAVQYFLSLLLDYDHWQRAVGEKGFFATYKRLFGWPFAYSVEPLLPPDLHQPPMQLPFEKDVPWLFTGGHHPAWGDGSAWAALDFAPYDTHGCAVSKAWVVAVADGLVVRSDHGVVMQDLDGDGYEQTGWDVLYLHIAAKGRVAAGTYLHAGERIGHPSCEGGVANATHLHIARKYNGEWVSADGPIPFVLDGWVSAGAGKAYDGFLRRDGRTLEACECRAKSNTIKR